VRANDIQNFVLTLIDAFVNVTAQRLKIIEDINYEQCKQEQMIHLNCGHRHSAIFISHICQISW
jgi:hypothetical protein